MLYTSSEYEAQMIVLGRGAIFNGERHSSGDIMFTDQEFLQLFILILVLIKNIYIQKLQKRFPSESYF